MRIRINSIIVIIILLLSVTISTWNFNSKGKNPDNDAKNINNQRFNKLPRNGKFDWGEIEVISEPNNGQNININVSSNSKIAVENGKIYVVWSDMTDFNEAGGDPDIFFRFFDGSQWSDIQIISEPVPGNNINNDISSDPDIIVENGTIYVVWRDWSNINGSGTDDDIFYRCNLTGADWEDIQIISEPVFGNNFNTGSSQDPSIEVENGKIYVLWSDDDNTSNSGIDRDIFYRINITGSNWEEIQVISEPIINKDYNTGGSYTPKIIVVNNRSYTVWSDKSGLIGAGGDKDIYYRSNLTGSNWEDIQVISEPIINFDFNTGSSSYPDIAVENNNIYIVWDDDTNYDNSGMDYDIFYRCNLTGVNWENIQVISEPVLNQDYNVKDSLEPAISVDNSRIYVVWGDENNTNSAGDDKDIFYIGNLSNYKWEPIYVISEPIFGINSNIGYSNNPDIAVEIGIIHVVWHDNNDTNGADIDSDIFTRTISLKIVLDSPTVTPILGDTSTNFNFSVYYFNFQNSPPIKIIVNISGDEYQLKDVDQLDINYTDGKKYYFNIKNLEIKAHTYQFLASDGIYEVSTNLFNNPIVYNTLPDIITEDNLTAIEDIYYEVRYEYEDIDILNIGQLGIWNFLTNANWLTLNTTTAILNGTPTNDDVGEYWVNITINDGIDKDLTNFTLTVLNINDPPLIVTTDILTANEDKYYEVKYEAIDIDTPLEDLIWNMNTNAIWLEFEPTTALLYGTPKNNDVGEYWVNISVGDNEYLDYSNFTLKVINENNPPKIITEDVIFAIEDEYYEVDYQAEDADNAPNELVWDFDTNAKWLTFDLITAILFGTPTNDDVGEYWVNITIIDGIDIDYSNFTLMVINTNDPPIITTEDITTTSVGELYSVNYEATDIDPTNDVLKWSLKTNATDWLTIDTAIGLLIGTPSQNDAGFYQVNVSVWDGKNGQDYSNFTLYVTKEPHYGDEDFRLFKPNINPLEGDTETEFTFSIHYYSSENKSPISIQLIVDSNIYNLTLKSGDNASNGTYEYKLKLSEGIHTYYFSASNGSETIKTDNFVTPYFKKVSKPPGEESFWYWPIMLILIVIIIISIIFLLIYRKRKAQKIPVVKAELLSAPPGHLTLPSVTAGEEGASPLPSPVVVAEQFPTPKVTTPSLAPTPVKPQYQLPQATLTKAQKLGLLKERLLRGEITEETYKEFKSEIESSTGGEIPEGEIEDLSTIDEQQPSEPIAAPPVVPPQVEQPQAVVQPPQPTVTPKVEAPTPSAPPEPPAFEVATPTPAPQPSVKPSPQPTVPPTEPATATPKVGSSAVTQPPSEPKLPEPLTQKSKEDEEKLKKE